MKLRTILYVIVVVLVAIQFIPSKVTSFEKNSFVENMDSASANTKAAADILANNCMDCHSMQLKKPWYYHIQPITMILDHHVEEGREHLNFEEWAVMSKKDRLHALEECIEEVEEGHMPLTAYTILHGKLSDEERQNLISFFKGVESQIVNPE